MMSLASLPLPSPEEREWLDWSLIFKSIGMNAKTKRRYNTQLDTSPNGRIEEFLSFWLCSSNMDYNYGDKPKHMTTGWTE